MQETETETEDEFTRRELKLRPGMQQLAVAVVEQWILDGRPACDRDSIMLWAGLANLDIKNL